MTKPHKAILVSPIAPKEHFQPVPTPYQPGLTGRIFPGQLLPAISRAVIQSNSFCLSLISARTTLSWCDSPQGNDGASTASAVAASGSGAHRDDPGAFAAAHTS